MVSFLPSNSCDSSNVLVLNTKEGCEYALGIIDMKIIPKLQKQLKDCKDETLEDENDLFNEMENKLSIYNNEHDKWMKSTICFKRWWYNLSDNLPDFLEELRFNYISAQSDFFHIRDYNEDMHKKISCIEQKIKQFENLANSLELCMKFGGAVSITGVQYEIFNDIEYYQEDQNPYR